MSAIVKSIIEFKPGDLWAVTKKPIPNDVVARIKIEIESVDLADFKCSIFAHDSDGQQIWPPLPGDDNENILNGSLDLDLNALKLNKNGAVQIEFFIRHRTTEFRPSDLVPFTTNKDSKGLIFFDNFDAKYAKLWIKLKPKGKAQYVTYNIHFVTRQRDGKIIDWAFDPKVRNDG